MTRKNFDAAIYAIKITERTLIVGNVVSHWVYCAQTGERNCTLGLKLKKKIPLLMQNTSLLMKMGILTCEWEGKYYVFTCAK